MLKKLKSLFVIEEEGKGKSTETSAPASKKTKSTTKTSTSKPKAVESDVVPGKPAEKFVNILLGAIEKNNLEGFDYLEYKQSLQSLSEMKMDEETQFKSAFAMASTMGTDKSKLMSSINHYLSVLNDEEVKFNGALTNQMAQKVGQRQSDIKTLQDTITHKESQIEQLMVEIEKHKTQLEAVKKEISGAESKVQSTKASFYGSYKVVYSQMEADLAKIKKYL